MRPRFDLRAIRACHRISDVVRACGVNLTPKGRAWWACCPFHTERTPSFKVDDNWGNYVCFGCGAHGDLIEFVMRAEGLSFAAACGRLAGDTVVEGAGVVRDREVRREAGQHRRESAEARDRMRIELAGRLWARAVSITPDCPAGRYLCRQRGFPPPWPPTLRYLRAARHPTGVRVPAMVAAASRWPERSAVAVQITALTTEGQKASLSPVRWTLGALNGAAVPLSPWREGSSIALSEGVEDALAVSRAMPEIAAWATLGARNAVRVVVPDGAPIILALDGDDAGRAAAATSAPRHRARGHRVLMVELPDGMDPAAYFMGPHRIESMESAA